MARQDRKQTARRRQPNDVQAMVDDDLDEPWLERLPTPEQDLRRRRRVHCEKLGIDPDAVSDAVRILAHKFKQGPLEILWEMAADPHNSKSSRVVCAQAILPYLTAKPQAARQTGPVQTPGVMLVPFAGTMDEWSAHASAQQAALKDEVTQ